MEPKSNELPTGSSRAAAHTTEPDGSYERACDSVARVPGAVVVFSDGKPVMQPFPLRGTSLRIGRDGSDRDEIRLSDVLLSRAHAEFVYTGTQWIVRDLDSSNGTYVNGARLAPSSGCYPREQAEAGSVQVVRVGRSLVLLCHDMRSLLNGTVETDGGFVCGPQLRSVMTEVEQVGRSSETLHINGASGVGKELAARRFHASSPRAQGPFVAVNCAAIPGGIAERLLFGAMKGAFSGADANATGYVQASHGGTLFLDEIAELDLLVQAKLLRVLEAGEVIPLGATTPVPVDVLLCSATHTDLRNAVAQGKFRSDLYFRVARPEVMLPPLCDRREEIPFLVSQELKRLRPELKVDASLVEACLIRPWPGNVRELQRELSQAGRRALAADSTIVSASMLSANAGVAFAQSPRVPRVRRTHVPTPDELIVLLDHEKWNVAAAARTLGVHRTQLCRWMRRFGIKRGSRWERTID